jgi:hypothetical protein
MHQPHPIPGIPELLLQSRTDRSLAEATFNRMPVEQQCLLLAQARAKDRMALLMLAADCAVLVRSMTPVALAQTVQAADDDAYVFGRFATAQQLAAAIDLDAGMLAALCRNASTAGSPSSSPHRSKTRPRRGGSSKSGCRR